MERYEAVISSDDKSKHGRTLKVLADGMIEACIKAKEEAERDFNIKVGAGEWSMTVRIYKEKGKK